MCTLSYYPLEDGFIFTSNRDEQTKRLPAEPPRAISNSQGYVYYPVDGQSGGTWFIVNEKGNAAVLLNGAGEKHVPLATYRQSRGTILPLLFDRPDPLQALTGLDLKGIENFTLVLCLEKELFVFEWDGTNAYLQKQDASQAQLWSSVTLYDKEMRAERKSWFGQLLESSSQLQQEQLTRFHRSGGAGNTFYGLNMNREDKLKTLCITSAMVTPEGIRLYHEDLVSGKVYKQFFSRRMQAL